MYKKKAGVLVYFISASKLYYTIDSFNPRAHYTSKSTKERSKKISYIQSLHFVILLMMGLILRSH